MLIACIYLEVLIYIYVQVQQVQRVQQVAASEYESRKYI